ncbi:MAG: M15 family metallopeptidase [bacterium]|nr:M15 family metallopeptidase [bacterium]
MSFESVFIQNNINVNSQFLSPMSSMGGYDCGMSWNFSFCNFPSLFTEFNMSWTHPTFNFGNWSFDNIFSQNYTAFEAPIFPQYTSSMNTDNFFASQIYMPTQTNYVPWQFDYKPQNVQRTNISSKTDGTKNKKESIAIIGSGGELKDGTSVTVEGLDYSICGSSADEVKKLRPEMQNKVIQLFKYANNKGWDLSISSGFRTQAEQDNLVANGAPAAKGNSSRHLYGCAVDLKINNDSHSPHFKELDEYAKSIGMRGGVHCNGIFEPWHFDVDPKSTPKAKQNNSVA